MTNRPFPSDIFFAHSIPIPITPRQHSTPGQLLNNVPLPFFVTFIIPHSFPSLTIIMTSPITQTHVFVCPSVFQRVDTGHRPGLSNPPPPPNSPKNSFFLSFTVLLPEPHRWIDFLKEIHPSFHF